MTVKELMEKLKKFDGDMKVYLNDSDWGMVKVKQARLSDEYYNFADQDGLENPGVFVLIE